MTEGDVPAQESVDRRLSTIPAEETGRRGKEIYDRDIRSLVEPEHDGKFVAIDVDSGCWALGEEKLDAADRLEAERPEAVNVCLHWVGDQNRVYILTPFFTSDG